MGHIRVGSGPIFLLSPANCSGPRAQLLLRGDQTFDLARRLAEGQATLGEVFAFISGLYFRGKLAYAGAFGGSASNSGRHARRGRPPFGRVYVITPSRGLLAPGAIITREMIQEFARVDVHLKNLRYREPLERDLALLASSGIRKFILLGSIASDKYTDLLLTHLGSRVFFPGSFVGRGDMSRGGLMLRAVTARQELTYVPLVGATLHGPRPPRLEKIR